MRRLEALLKRLAPRTSPVLITGDTGVGKEVCARFLHAAGSRATAPFMAVNCAAIPAELMESELFGHERGAFTGATAQHKGYAERARDGTLFLDEVADLARVLQGKLLRVLEDRQFTRVGGEQPVAFTARTLCATHRRIDQMVADGRFREDLFYRINVVTVHVPPLRERKDDIPWLMQRFFRELRSSQDVDCKGFSTLAEQAALSHAWPGNTRELRNRVERAILLAAGEWIMPGDLFPESGDSSASERFISLRAARDEAERRQIERALKETGGHVIEAARLLDISRTTLWEKMKRLGIVVPDDL
jgi:two-component system, NtrC family, response regulator HydG